MAERRMSAAGGGGVLAAKGMRATRRRRARVDADASFMENASVQDHGRQKKRPLAGPPFSKRQSGRSYEETTGWRRSGDQNIQRGSRTCRQGKFKRLRPLRCFGKVHLPIQNGNGHMATLRTHGRCS